MFLKILQNSQKNTCVRASFLIKFRPATLLKKRLWHRCFSVNFAKYSRAPVFIEHLWWLLLVWCNWNNIVITRVWLQIFICMTWWTFLGLWLAPRIQLTFTVRYNGAIFCDQISHAFCWSLFLKVHITFIPSLHAKIYIYCITTYV